MCTYTRAPRYAHIRASGGTAFSNLHPSPRIFHPRYAISLHAGQVWPIYPKGEGRERIVQSGGREGETALFAASNLSAVCVRCVTLAWCRSRDDDTTCGQQDLKKNTLLNYYLEINTRSFTKRNINVKKFHHDFSARVGKIRWLLWYTWYVYVHVWYYFIIVQIYNKL